MRKVVVDTNVLLDLFEEEKMSFETLLKSLNIILLTENIDGIIILDSVYSEIEKLKKGTIKDDKRTEIAKKIYRLIGEAIEENVCSSFPIFILSSLIPYVSTILPFTLNVPVLLITGKLSLSSIFISSITGAALSYVKVSVSVFVCPTLSLAVTVRVYVPSGRLIGCNSQTSRFLSVAKVTGTLLPSSFVSVTVTGFVSAKPEPASNAVPLITKPVPWVPYRFPKGSVIRTSGSFTS